MSRPLRIEFQDAYYHVMNRGRGRQKVFHEPAYYEDFLKCLNEAHNRFGVEVHSYCLLGNHYHLLLKTPRGNLGRIMRHIDGVYTQRHNRRKKTDGALFRGRYKAIVIDAGRYLLQVSRYIHRNPVELKKPLVKNLADYPWSSFAAFINEGAVPSWLNRDKVYAELGNAKKHSAYKAFIDQDNDIETEKFYQLENTPSVWGDKKFKAYAYRQAQSLDSEIDKKGINNTVPLLEIVERVAKAHGLAVGEVQKARRGQGANNIARWMAMKLCQEVGGAKLSDIATVFGVGHYSTVSQTIGRLNRLIEEDEQMNEAYNMLSQDLTR